MADRGSIGGVQALVAGVIGPVLIAASGYGGFHGMRALLDRLDDPNAFEPTEAADSTGFRIEGGSFSVVVPDRAESLTRQAPDGLGGNLTVTAWLPVGEPDPFVAIYAFDLPVPAQDTATISAALRTEVASVAASFGTIERTWTCNRGVDAAECASVRLQDDVGYAQVTSIAHGLHIVDILTASQDSDNLDLHEDVLASIVWAD